MTTKTHKIYMLKRITKKTIKPKLYNLLFSFIHKLFFNKTVHTPPPFPTQLSLSLLSTSSSPSKRQSSILWESSPNKIFIMRSWLNSNGLLSTVNDCKTHCDRCCYCCCHCRAYSKANKIPRVPTNENKMEARWKIYLNSLSSTMNWTYYIILFISVWCVINREFNKPKRWNFHNKNKIWESCNK